MNYLNNPLSAASAPTFPFRKSPALHSWPATLSRTELKRIIAEALG
jgi:hypothetical protein